MANNNTNIVPYGQGPAKLATTEELAKDTEGFTHPNLHRRITNDPSTSNTSSEVGVYGVNSYHIITSNSSDGDSNGVETP